MMHETPQRDRGDSRATRQPQGLGPASGFVKRGGARGRDGLRRKAHPEPLPSLDDRSDPQAFHHNPAQRPGLPLHYQCRDYAPLQSRPPCHCSLVAAGSRSHSVRPHRAYSSERRTARSAVAAGGSCIMRVNISPSTDRGIIGAGTGGTSLDLVRYWGVR